MKFLNTDSKRLQKIFIKFIHQYDIPCDVIKINNLPVRVDMFLLNYIASKQITYSNRGNINRLYKYFLDSLWLKFALKHGIINKNCMEFFNDNLRDLQDKNPKNKIDESMFDSINTIYDIKNIIKENYG